MNTYVPNPLGYLPLTSIVWIRLPNAYIFYSASSFSFCTSVSLSWQLLRNKGSCHIHNLYVQHSDAPHICWICFYLYSCKRLGTTPSYFVSHVFKSKLLYIVYILCILYPCILSVKSCFYCLFNSTPWMFRQHQLHTKHSINDRLQFSRNCVLNRAMPGVSLSW